MTENDTQLRRFHMQFSASAWEVVVTMSQRYSLIPTETVREAVSLMWWLTREMDAGNKMLIQRGEAVNELLFSFRERI